MRTRPAETSAVAAALAVLIGRLAGIHDPDTITALAVVVGVIPAGVTWLVNLRWGRRPPLGRPPA